jgi:hypothetical protein
VIYRTVRGVSSRARASLPPAGVLLASTGEPFSPTAIALAARWSGGSRVRVVTVARIHGSSLGLQHPGLMPSKRERDQAQAIVTNAIRALQRADVRADGEVVITRGAARAFARAARGAREVRHVIVDDPRAGRLGRLLTAAAARSVRYRLKGIGVTAVSGGVVHDADGGHRQEPGRELDQLDRAV